VTLALAGLLGLLLAAVVFGLLRSRDILSSIALLSAYSGLVAVLLCLMGAPDVAFTETVVGSGVSTVLLMSLVRRVDSYDLPRRGALARLGALLLAAGLGTSLMAGVLALPAFGDPGSIPSTVLSPDYARRCLDDSATPNVVTAVLADYRGFDTLIETTVVAVAALGCLLVRGRAA
jgi:multicomponent Na+:H+ antiporter subunit B